MQCAAVKIQRLLSTTPPHWKSPLSLSMTCHGQAPRAAHWPLTMYGPTFVMFGERRPHNSTQNQLTFNNARHFEWLQRRPYTTINGTQTNDVLVSVRMFLVTVNEVAAQTADCSIFYLGRLCQVWFLSLWQRGSRTQQTGDVSSLLGCHAATPEIDK